MPNPLTVDELELAKKLRREGETWAAIGRTLGKRDNTVRAAVSVEFREHRAMLAAAWSRRRRTRPDSMGDIGVGPECPRPHNGEPPERLHIPPEVLEDRDRRRELDPISITAALLGDPLPGRSALDQRKPHLVVSNDDRDVDEDLRREAIEERRQRNRRRTIHRTYDDWKTDADEQQEEPECSNA